MNLASPDVSRQVIKHQTATRANCRANESAQSNERKNKSFFCTLHHSRCHNLTLFLQLMIVFFFQLDYCILCCQESITVVSFVVSSSNYLIHPTRWKCFCRVNFHFTDCGGHIVHRCLQYYD